MPYSRSKTITLVTLALVTVLAACGGFVETIAPADEGLSTSSTLGDTEWVLTSLNGKGLIEGTNITLGFDEEGLSGFAGCNAYGGGPDGREAIATQDGTLTIPGLAITAQLCLSPEGIMEQEQAYVEALSSAATYRMTDDRLEIGDVAGETTLVFARKEEFPMDPGDLVGTAWLLRSVNGSAPVEGSTITLVFHDESKIVGVAGCRGYYGTYEASGDDVGFPMLGMTGSVERCSEALTVQEAEYTTSLEWATDYRLNEVKLEISTARGEVLAFEPLPKDDDASLESAPWTLTAFVETKTIEEMSTPVLSLTDPLAETRITAEFENGTLSGSAGCNGYSGAYALDGSALTVGTIAATEMACLDPAGAMEQEQRYLGSLGDVSTYAVFGNRLWLETDDGRGLVFRRIADVSKP
jgi:heat shock protein HslJ